MYFVIVINWWIWAIIVSFIFLHLLHLKRFYGSEQYSFPLYVCTFDSTARILCHSVVATAKDSPQGEIKMAEDRFSKKPKRSMCSSSLYKSTLDDLVVEDKAVNVVSSTEHLEVFFCVHFPFLSLSHQFSSQWSTLIVLAEESWKAWLVHLSKPERSQNSNPAHLWWLCSPGGDLGYVYFKPSITGS